MRLLWARREIANWKWQIGSLCFYWPDCFSYFVGARPYVKWEPVATAEPFDDSPGGRDEPPVTLQY